ncbi:MAG: hypothetical protein R2736_03305 [Solirubrobacterales bacterium]
MPRLLALVAVLLVALAATASAATARTCRSADLRYPFTKGGPETFGVFKLKIREGDCATAHTVAKRWMTRFERNLDAGRVRLPKRVADYTFTQLKPKAAQTYRLRGIRAATTIRFDYVVPNG